MRKLSVVLLALALVLCSAYVPDRASSAGVNGTDVVGSVLIDEDLGTGVEVICGADSPCCGLCGYAACAGVSAEAALGM